MIKPPEIDNESIRERLESEYELRVAQISFLPLGADLNTALYQVVADDERRYFLKLRRGDFHEAAATIPKFLSDVGLKPVIPPLTTEAGNLWSNLGRFKLVLYPFVAGYNGFQIELSDKHWVEFGRALKSFHSTAVPPALTYGIPRETYSSKWRKIVKSFLVRIDRETSREPVAAQLAAFLKTKLDETLSLVRRTEGLALSLQAQDPSFILCHGDIHAGNLLIDECDGLHIVDWDTLIFAPKERDLMFVGAGLGGGGRTPGEETELFYRGYGQTDMNPTLLTYYRLERIVEDIAVICQQLFLSEGGGQDRKQALEFLQSNYLPGGTLEIARQSDMAWSDA